MRVEPTVFDGPEDIGRALAALIAEQIGEAEAGRSFLLGCPSGRSARTAYAELAREVTARRLDLGDLVIVMMDEYIERDDVTGRMRRIDDMAPHSCRRFGQVDIVDQLNAAAGPGRGISPDRFWVPDPEAPGDYDRQIAEHGGIDLFILASGAGDGHVAFNPPGSGPETTTRVVRLAEQTRRDSLSTFPSFGMDIDQVPRYAVTVGVGTIRDQSKQAVLVAHGASKARAVRRISEAHSYQPEWPSTILADCASPLLFVDKAAASELTQHSSLNAEPSIVSTPHSLTGLPVPGRRAG
jgi:glucosamine-6-phosphate deaminase